MPSKHSEGSLFLVFLAFCLTLAFGAALIFVLLEAGLTKFWSNLVIAQVLLIISLGIYGWVRWWQFRLTDKEEGS